MDRRLRKKCTIVQKKVYAAGAKAEKHILLITWWVRKSNINLHEADTRSVSNKMCEAGDEEKEFNTL